MNQNRSFAFSTCVVLLVFLIVGVAWVAAVAHGASREGSAKPLPDVNIAWTNYSANQAPTMVADAQRFFQKHGLNAHVSYIEGSPTATAALVGNSIQILETGPVAAIQAQLKGQDVVVLAIHIPYPNFRLVAMPNVRDLNDLRGKIVGVSQPGSVDDVVTRELLKKKGFTLGKDVKILYVKSNPAKVSALSSNLVGAVTLSPLIYQEARSVGARELLNFREMGIAYPLNGVESTRRFVKERRDLVVAYLKASVEAIRFIKSRPDETKQIIGRYTKQTDPEVLDISYQELVGVLPDNPAPTLEAVQIVLSFLKGGEGKNPADFVDPGPLQQAIRELDRKK